MVNVNPAGEVNCKGKKKRKRTVGWMGAPGR